MPFEIAHCKNCNHEQQYFRIPKTWRQFFWGGYTCPKCKAELDTGGNIVKMPDTTKPAESKNK